MMFSSIIFLGPASFGFFSSSNAGRSMISMRVEAPKKSNKTVVGFGIIHYLLIFC